MKRKKRKHFPPQPPPPLKNFWIRACVNIHVFTPKMVFSYLLLKEENDAFILWLARLSFRLGSARDFRAVDTEMTSTFVHSIDKKINN